MNTDKIAIPLAIVIAGVIIAGALYFSKPLPTVKTGVTTGTTTDVKVRPISNDDHIFGNPDAKIILVEYSDTECPYCKQFQITLKQIMDLYGSNGDVAWVYRHFPIDQLHSKARKEAEATECVNELGGPTKFWDFLNMIYTNTPSNNGLDASQLPVFAKAVGVDVTAFNTCLSSGRYAAKVQADYEDAVKSGGQGTPHTILVMKDGSQTPVDGAYPFADLKAIIDTLLVK